MNDNKDNVPEGLRDPQVPENASEEEKRRNPQVPENAPDKEQEKNPQVPGVGQA